MDERTPPLITGANSGEITDFEWPLNEVRVDLAKISVPGEPLVLRASFATLTPNFSHYRLAIDGKPIPVDGEVYLWKLHKGTNTLAVAAINQLDRSGFPSEFTIEYDPSQADYSRRVTSILENPGFEQAHPDSPADPLRPDKWGTICSNPWRYGAFALDPEVKHAGNYALKATPARNPETGIEYAFIAKSADFQVNAGTDAIYSIWLKAAAADTPVDLALLESTYKGLGTYVERVAVGTSWQRYELKCRLHNEMNQVYVGFKVYTGTVWADEARYEEQKPGRQ